MRNSPPSPRRVRSLHESKSATVRAAAAAPSRRQRSRWQREQENQRRLYLAAGGLVAIVLLILGGGLIYDNVIRPNEVVAQVGPDSITAGQLLDAMRPSVRAIDAQARQVAGTGGSAAQYADQQKRQLPDQTLNELVDQRIIQHEADRRGISVSTEEIDARERQTVAEFQAASNPAPTPEATSTPEQAATTSTPAAASSPTPVPTLEPSAYGVALKELLDRENATESEFRDRIQHTLLQDKVEAAVGQEQVPETQEQVHARHILVNDEDAAKQALSQLQSGSDFAQLASQISNDPGSKDKGGDLGWFPRGVMDKPFEDAAFALQPGQLSDVVEGANGFHIIQVLERDPNRPIPADQLATLRQKASSTWLGAQRTGSDVHLELSPAERDWLLGKLGVRP